jgi:glycosyltransferase involved in cell wall biosynthesis
MSPAQVTVVVPCYNAERYLADTLAALQRQSCQNWRAVIVDDGSTDCSARIAEAYCDQDERFTLVCQANSGVSYARNVGVSAARSEFIAFLDADDMWHAGYLTGLLEFMSQDPARDIGFAQVRIVDEDGHATGDFCKPKRFNLNLFDLLSGNPTTTCSNLFVRRNVFLRAGQFRIGLSHAEDQLWLIGAYLSGCIIEGLDEVLLDYRTNSNGLSSNLEAMQDGWEVICYEALKRHPRFVGPMVHKARSLNNRYLARRALRLQPRTGSAGHYMYRSLYSNWTQLLTSPWPVWPLSLACLFDTLASKMMKPASQLKSGTNS